MHHWVNRVCRARLCPRGLSPTAIRSSRLYVSLAAKAMSDPGLQASTSGTSSSVSNSVPWFVKYTRWRPTSTKEAMDSEKQVYDKLVSKDVPLELEDVQVGPGKEQYLHTLTAGPPHVQPTVVMMPGYGAGIGFYYRNLEGLSKALRIKCVDWLGTGLSGRPSYTAQSREEAESFFLESLAAWKQKQGLDKIVLVGHSLGGYLAASYALKHPDHVAHLVLVCPAGVPKAPEEWEQRVLGKGWSLRGQFFKSAMWAWEKGVTPGSFIRAIGPWGPNIVNKYVSGRFKHHGAGLTSGEVDVFKHYFYHIAAGRGSGEYALRHLLAPGAYAHAPLEGRLHELQVPVTFIYGKHDWMKPEHAIRVCEELRKERAPRTQHDLSVEVIDDAGHFVFMDQPELFNKALTAVCAQYLTTADGSASSAAVQFASERTDVRTSADGAAVSWGFAASGKKD